MRYQVRLTGSTTKGYYSMVTTNLEFSRWGSILTDDQMAAAMIDRIIHHGHLVVFDGPTKRMENSPMAHRVPSS